MAKKLKTEKIPLVKPTDSLDQVYNKVKKQPPVLTPYELPPGLHLNVPFGVYLDIPGYNASYMKRVVSASLAHANAPGASDDTPFFRFGRFTHSSVLEPGSLDRMYCVQPTDEIIVELFDKHPTEANTYILKSNPKKTYVSPTATGAYKEAVAKWRDTVAAGREVISRDDCDDIAGMLHTLAENSQSRSLLRDGCGEVTLIWQAKDLFPNIPLFKARLDWLSLQSHLVPRALRVVGGAKNPIRWEDSKSIPLIADINDRVILTDLKTTSDIIRFDAFEYHYDIQDAFYRWGWLCALGMDPTIAFEQIHKVWFEFVVIESKPPYQCIVSRFSSADIHAASVLLQAALQHLDTAIKTGHFPGPASPSVFTSRHKRRVNSSLISFDEELSMYPDS